MLRLSQTFSQTYMGHGGDGSCCVKGVIFDMDGLMFDTEVLCTEGWFAVAERYGLAGMNRDFIAGTKGVKRDVTEALFKEYFGNAIDFVSFYADRDAYVNERIDEQGVPVKPGLIELLTVLQQLGIPRAVASSSGHDRVYGYLRKAGLVDRFDAIVTGSDIKNGKPNPEIFLAAAGRLGLAPFSCLVLEDALFGVKAAMAAGMPVILVPDEDTANEESASLATGIADSLADVIDLFPSSERNERKR
ncbi:hydrolase [Clostridia bacterium]|nr:hydrolase [Clostridia bacterium]